MAQEYLHSKSYLVSAKESFVLPKAFKSAVEAIDFSKANNLVQRGYNIVMKGADVIRTLNSGRIKEAPHIGETIGKGEDGKVPQTVEFPKDNVELFCSDELPERIVEARGWHLNPEIKGPGRMYTAYYDDPDRDKLEKELLESLRRELGDPYFRVMVHIRPKGLRVPSTGKTHLAWHLYVTKTRQIVDEMEKLNKSDPEEFYRRKKNISEAITERIKGKVKKLATLSLTELRFIKNEVDKLYG